MPSWSKILRDNLRKNRVRTLERDKAFWRDATTQHTGISWCEAKSFSLRWWKVINLVPSLLNRQAN